MAKGIAEYKADNPLLSEEDAIRSLLPDAIILKDAEGKLQMQMDG